MPTLITRTPNDAELTQIANRPDCTRDELDALHANRSRLQRFEVVINENEVCPVRLEATSLDRLIAVVDARYPNRFSTRVYEVDAHLGRGALVAQFVPN